MNCKGCKKDFTLLKQDKELLEKFNVLNPNHCPDCRAEQRFAFRNERFLYQRQCDKCSKKIISVFSLEKEYTVYCHDCWYGDKWSATDYGIDYDHNKPFFDQVNELMHQTPHPGSIIEAPTCFNSDYANDASSIKNCYLTFDVSYLEDSFYGESAWKLKNCIDFLNSFDCELSYEISYCTKSYNLFFSEYCANCYDSYFLRDCVGCNNCFACCNLINAKHCIWNKQYSEDEYYKEIKKLKKKLNNYSELKQLQKQFLDFIIKFPKRATRGVKNDNCTGDNINYSKGCYYCFDSNNSENCRYAYKMMNGAKECMDVTIWGENTELCYNSGGVGMKSYNNICCHYAWRSASNLTYCYFCHRNVKDMLGCVNMQSDQYCILNKRYSKKDYLLLREKIINKLKQEGVYGDFFPAYINPFCYNETQAQEYFPLTKEQAINKGWTWKNEKNNSEGEHDHVCLRGLPTCISCNKNFKIIPQEKKFYQDNEIAFPQKCPNCRHLDRIKFRNPNKFWQRLCDKCNQQIMTTYSPDRPEKIYCKKCYQKEVY